MSHFFTGDTILDILPSDNPNEGRVKINYNFDLIEEVFGEAIHGVLSGHSITEGGTNINVVSGSTMGIPLYTVSLDDDISLNSVSANTLSGGTLYSGSTDLYDIFLTENDGNDITRVQSGTNTFTGGTANNPTVNLDDDISLNSVSANTISLESTTMAQVIMQPVNVAAPADGSMWFTTSGGTTTLNYQVTGTTKSVELT